MNQYEWIVCERQGHWAASLRVTAARNASRAARMPRIYEVRSLDELAERLTRRPASLAFVEARVKDLAKLLPWLAEFSQRFPLAHFVALMDRAADFPAGCAPAISPRANDDVGNALLEAGATDIAISPRHLQHLFALADRHAALVADDAGRLDGSHRGRTSLRTSGRPG